MKKTFGIISIVFGVYLLLMCGVSFISANTLHVKTSSEYGITFNYVGPVFEDPSSKISVDELVSFGIGVTYRICEDEMEAIVLMYEHTQFFIMWTFIDGILAVFFIAGGILMLVFGVRRKAQKQYQIPSQKFQ